MPKVRFIPGPTQDDAETVVLGIELHEDLVVVDVATTEIDAIRRPTRRRQLPHVRVEDDIGNTYRGIGMSHYGANWSGQAPVAHFPMEFRPTVPSEARFLRIRFGGIYAENRTVVVML
jgi:hypothetical protein